MALKKRRDGKHGRDKKNAKETRKRAGQFDPQSIPKLKEFLFEYWQDPPPLGTPKKRADLERELLAHVGTLPENQKSLLLAYLTPLFKDKRRNFYLRCRCGELLSSLARTGHGNAFNELANRFADKKEKPELRGHLAQCIGYAKRSVSAPILLKALAEEKHEGVYGDILVGMGFLRDPHLVPLLQKGLRHRQPYVRQCAVHGLERIGRKTALRPLIETRTNPKLGEGLQVIAGTAIQRIGEKIPYETLSELVRFIEETNDPGKCAKAVDDIHIMNEVYTSHAIMNALYEHTKLSKVRFMGGIEIELEGAAHELLKNQELKKELIQELKKALARMKKR